MRQQDITFFDRSQDYCVTERLLPHWAQAGAMCFITWRTADSLPAHVLRRIDDEIAAVLRSENLPTDEQWKSALQRCEAAARARVHRRLFAVRDKYLDAGHGRCLLTRPRYAAIVMDSLQPFDEDRYFLTDAVVMPNHVHFLVAFPSEESMLRQCTSWKRFTGRQINAAQNERGEFWQVDQFDHLVRGLEEFEYYRRYIKENPISAGLNQGQFLNYSKQLTA